MSRDDRGAGPKAKPAHETLPFPESLCHSCAAPPRYVKTERSIFILCPKLPRKYPPQPVLGCPLYTPAAKPPSR